MHLQVIEKANDEIAHRLGRREVSPTLRTPANKLARAKRSWRRRRSWPCGQALRASASVDMARSCYLLASSRCRAAFRAACGEEQAQIDGRRFRGTLAWSSRPMTT